MHACMLQEDFVRDDRVRNQKAMRQQATGQVELILNPRPHDLDATCMHRRALIPTEEKEAQKACADHAIVRALGRAFLPDDRNLPFLRSV
ncbi:MAG: hypothetical protein N3F11_09895 [Casimicrobiaceae bacterium]|nr:hypothetical protein [Casimicrobiaceae bacterium]